MRFGKLTTEELQSLVLDKLRVSRSEVLLSAAAGEDCAAVSVDGYTLYSSDPITAAMPPRRLGALAVDVCCNDIAACGGEPIALLLVVIVPPECPLSEIEQIMDGARAKADEIRVDIVGGHTEFSDCVTRPIISGTAIGKTKRLMTKKSLKAGDKLYVTKTLGMEGTIIIVDAGHETLSKEQEALCESYRLKLSVDEESKILRTFPSVGMMHDVTEGGIIGAVAEVCLGCGLGARIYESALPVDGLTRELCAKYGIDPARLISSGSMLFSASDGSAALALRNAGIAVSEIGCVTEKDVLFIGVDGKSVSVRPETDQLYKFFERCDK